LISVTIGDGVTSIGGYAFYNCGSLTSVVIGDGVTSIGEYAFYYCNNLTSVVIPDSVTSIGEYAFYDCDGLTSVEIPDGVTSIGGYAFNNCDGLTSVEIPDGVTSIGLGAFYNCSRLTSVVIGDGVTRITSVFGGCGNLTSLVIGESVETIDPYVFSDCYRLVEVVNKSTHITVAKGSSSNGYVGRYALAVYNSGDAFTSKLSNDNGYIVYTDGNEKILVGYNGTETDLVLPSYITKINQYAFRDCDGVTSVEIGESVTSIGWGVFYNCYNLTSVTFKDTSTWYITTSSLDWENKTGGEETSVSTPSTNATYFKSTYYKYYWYKL
jgi:hypothetical protein